MASTGNKDPISNLIGKPIFIPESFSPVKNYSEAKAANIDEEVSRIVEESHQRVRKILSQRREVLNDLAHFLSERERVLGLELRAMLAASASGMASLPPEKTDDAENMNTIESNS